MGNALEYVAIYRLHNFLNPQSVVLATRLLLNIWTRFYARQDPSLSTVPLSVDLDFARDRMWLKPVVADDFGQLCGLGSVVGEQPDPWLRA